MAVQPPAPAEAPATSDAVRPGDRAPASIEVEGLTLAYGSSVAVEDATLRAEPGQVACVMGRNGAGKTTLMKGLMGIMPARRGRVVLDGVDITGQPSYRRARAGIGYVPQGRRIFAYLSVLENLMVALEPAGGKDEGQLDEVFELFPVLKQMSKRVAGVLSGGQQQQLAIGRALMGRPRVLLLDEPTEGIQPSIVEQIEEVIGSLRGRMTIILVEQFLDFALANADRCYVLESGSIALDGPPSELDETRLRQLLAV
ncbi:MAG: urea ABC transporter ATP-binding subunit UrtE [Dehalococcoidia bacterium]